MSIEQLDPALAAQLAAWMDRNSDDDDILNRVRAEAEEKIATSGGAMIQAGSSRADVAKKFNVSAELLDRVLPPPPPPKAPAPFIFSDEDVAALRAQKEELENLQSALKLLLVNASAPTPRAQAIERAPEIDRAQRRADLLGELKPLLVEDEMAREKARLARRAMKRMARRR